MTMKMNKNLRTPILVVLIGMIGLITGCKKDYEYVPPPLDPNVKIKFSTDIMPMFTASCYGSGCHDDGIPPDLTAANAWNSLTANGTFIGSNVDTVNDASSVLYVRMTTTTPNTPMPTSGLLPKAQTDKVLLWIQQGAENN